MEEGGRQMLSRKVMEREGPLERSIEQLAVVVSFHEGDSKALGNNLSRGTDC